MRSISQRLSLRLVSTVSQIRATTLISNMWESLRSWVPQLKNHMSSKDCWFQELLKDLSLESLPLKLQCTLAHWILSNLKQKEQSWSRMLRNSSTTRNLRNPMLRVLSRESLIPVWISLSLVDRFQKLSCIMLRNTKWWSSKSALSLSWKESARL